MLCQWLLMNITVTVKYVLVGNDATVARRADDDIGVKAPIVIEYAVDKNIISVLNGGLNRLD